MHLLSLDESGRPLRAALLRARGVAFRDRDWHELHDLWQATLALHSRPTDREVKWHGIRTSEVPPLLASAIVKSSPTRRSAAI